TLLAMLPRDVAGLRIIILGGEACPPSVADRWSREGRTIFNSYGPTEATVVATVAKVLPGETVTIGKPIANYTCYVVDDQLNIVEPGVEGELLIGGPGVATGYLKRPELTAEKFIANPFDNSGHDPVLYRSGDAVILAENDELLFRGRIDDQVKIRGFRVELGEIEARLAQMNEISAAAVVLRNDGGMDQLVAFITPVEGAKPEARDLRARLREALPAYMVPARFEIVGELPRLPSGKTDRKALKARELTLIVNTDVQEEPQNETEAALLAAAKKVLPPQSIPFDADFFTDLGGHSLIAAKLISELRQTPALAGVTLQDIYAGRTLRKLGQIIDDRAALMGGGKGGAPADLSFAPVPNWKRSLCGAAQAVALVPILALVTIQWLSLFLASIWILRSDSPLWLEMLTLLCVYAGVNISVKLLVIGLKWVIIGRTKPGAYPLWGAYYFRLWLVQRLVQVTTMKFLQCSPLMRWYMRALGAKVGKDAMIGEIEAGAIDLLTIGDNATVGLKNKFGNVEVIGNQVFVGPVTIGNGALTGNCCVISRDVVIGDDAQLKDLTALQAGTTVGAAEIWDGSPGKKVGDVNLAELPAIAEAGPLRRAAHAVVYSLSYIVILMFGLVPIFPAFYILFHLDELITGVKDLDVSWSMLPFVTWPAALALVIVAMALIIAVRWIVQPGRIQPGVYSIHSNFYLRKWIMGLAAEVTLETLSSLYATVYMGHWYRLMGAKIGKGTEVSTNLAGRYDLVDIGKGNFIGDETVFGDEEMHRGWITLHRVKTGDRVFFGNDSVVAAGSVIGDGALIGVKSKMPESLKVKDGETWFGSPPISIPSRQRVEGIPVHWTYEPPLWFKIFRYFFEAAHTSLPTAFFITLAFITADIIAEPLDEGKWGLAFLYFLFAGAFSTMACIAFTVTIKWINMGVYKPTMKPMWSFWAMRTEMVAVMYGGLAGKASNEYLRGTPFLPWVLRLHGCKIGKGVWMDLTDVTEFDCITVGDYCALNGFSCLQTHLYEDRIMKVGRVHLGKGVTVGWGATVLYDTKVGDYAQIAPLTVVMKGENIPAQTAWAGSPAQPARPMLFKPQDDSSAPAPAGKEMAMAA
ncbi:MAG: AMP-binding protein, partial [Alphaproteobacteria bacterium]|nr:AMP-binding protein [Alphaproteobacteria bacterium]